MEFCITAISVRDRDEDGTVYLTGRADDGRRVVVRVKGFRPWITVALRNGSSGRSLDEVVAAVWPAQQYRQKNAWGDEGGSGSGSGSYRQQGRQHVATAPYSAPINIDSGSEKDSGAGPTFMAKTLCGHAQDRFPAWRLRFGNESRRRAAAKHLEENEVAKRALLVAADNRVDAATQFQLDTGLRIWGWASIAPAALSRELARELMGGIIGGEGGGGGVAADVSMGDGGGCVALKPLPHRNSDLPPIRVLYWDIETAPALSREEGTGTGGISFEEDDVMIIGCVAKTLYASSSTATAALPADRRIAFCGPTAKHRDASLDPEFIKQSEEYVVCSSTRELLLRWQRFALKEFDADVLVAYNSRGFDLRMLFGAARRVGCGVEFARGGWSVLASDVCDLLEPPRTAAGSKQRGFNESYRLGGSFGRFELDLLLYLRGALKLRSYKLADVCKQFLPDDGGGTTGGEGEEGGGGREDTRKIELSYEQMWANVATPRGRAENAVYCLRDCAVLHGLVAHFEVLVQMIEMSRLTLTGLDDLLSRGQTVKIINQLALECHQRGYIMNRSPYASVTWTPAGATVLDPAAGYYEEDFIVTLDFQSLYPSIMIAHNLCMSTIVVAAVSSAAGGAPLSAAATATHEIRDPKGGEDAPVLRRHTYVTSEPGLLPVMLQSFLDARAAVRGMMKTEKDPGRLAVLNGRQLALKVSANSIYGFTGAPVTPWYTPAITETVTAIGRGMIAATSALINSTVTAEFLRELVDGKKGKGPPTNSGSRDSGEGTKGKKATVIYGDTDSVMIKMPPLLLPTPEGEGGTSSSPSSRRSFLAECIRCGPALAAWVTATLFMPPIKLTYEKTYFPYLILRKKRYAGMLYGSSPDKGYIDSKGTSDVRRDSFLVTSDLLGEIKENLIARNDRAGAVAAIARVLDDLVADRIPRAQYVMSKELKPAGSYVDPENTAHLVLAQKMDARAPGAGPRTGDRVQYVIVEENPRRGSSPSGKMVDKLEDPEYAEAHRVPIDRLYYLEHCLRKPILDFIGAICPEVAGAMERASVAIQHGRTGQKVFAPSVPSVPSACVRRGEGGGILAPPAKKARRTQKTFAYPK